MNKSDIIRKLTSRKLWLAIASFVSMLAVALGIAQGDAEKVAALIMSGASVLSYILAEGWADSAGAKSGNKDNKDTEDVEVTEWPL